MFDPQSVARQILRNCDISDARHAGLYSICGLALRLRDLYKWDTGTPPWEEKDSADVLDWIGRKEEKWERLADDDYGTIEVDGRRFAPFNTFEINEVLSPHGFLYGAGYGHRLKPTFFMAAIVSRQRRQNTTVFILGRELARDLMTLPALAQDNAVVLRTEAAGLYLWDKILYINKSGRRALEIALDACGVSDHRPAGIRRHLKDILAASRDTFILHEIGEMSDPVFNRAQWREIIGDFPHTGVELLARSVKDLLADTADQGPLWRIMDGKRTAALGFYAAFLDGLALALFPEIRPAFDRCIASGSWEPIEQAVIAVRERAGRHASQMMNICREGKRRGDMQWAAATIEKKLLRPLRGAPAAA